MSSLSFPLADFLALLTNNFTTNPHSEAALFACYRGLLLLLQSNLADSTIPDVVRAQLSALYEELLDKFRTEYGQYIAHFDAEVCSSTICINGMMLMRNFPDCTPAKNCRRARTAPRCQAGLGRGVWAGVSGYGCGCECTLVFNRRHAPGYVDTMWD
jgi:hypothetical protein